jgi:hypothetical protein
MSITCVRTVKPRLLVTAIAALAVLTATLSTTDRARASTSGGLGTATSSGGAGGGGEQSSARSSAKYDRLWDRVSMRDKRWAHQTSECESGGDPDAIGGGGLYRGAFQFMRSTWKHSPKSPGGDPIAYPYRTQAVVAVSLKRPDGTGHWPVCG